MNDQQNQQGPPMSPPNWNMPTMVNPVSPPPWWGNPWMMYGGGFNNGPGNQQRPMNNGNPWFNGPQNNQGNAQPAEIQNNQPVQTNSTNQNAETQENSRQTVPCGIIVEETDIKPADVPMNGGFGMFMRKDLSAIYIKQWQSDGKIYTKKYIEDPSENVPTGINSVNDDVLDKMNSRFEQIESAIYQLSQAVNASKGGNSAKKNNPKEGGADS